MQQKYLIKDACGMEILDSRGNPTVRAYVTLECGVIGVANVPSGASTAEIEAVELRDGDKARYGGKGVLTAVKNIREIISPRIKGCDACDQAVLDRLLVEIDGTKNFSRLGANAVLGVSMAAARAAASARQQPLYRCFSDAGQLRLPMPMMNVINGGKHSPNRLDFQEFMIVPVGAKRFSDAVRMGAETYHCLAKTLKAKGFSTGVGDEGGFAPELKTNREACDVLVAAINDAGYVPGKDIAIAIDPAASSFHRMGVYDLTATDEGVLDAEQLLARYVNWINNYPLVSIEDGFAEDDWDGFCAMTAKVGDKLQIVGDDNYSTNTAYIKEGIAKKASNAVLIKLNQIGTVTQTIDAVKLCRQAGWNYVISHRSGETDDAFISDFCVAMGGGQIKTGAPCRGERVAKYNRLMEIEVEMGAEAVFENPFTRTV